MSTNNNRYGKEIRPVWVSADAESKKIKILSGEKLQRLISNDLSTCTAISLSGRGINQIDDMVNMTQHLRRIDLSNNQLTRLHGFASFSRSTEHGNAKPSNAKDIHSDGLSLLNISSNAFKGDSGLEDLRYLTELRTLNISKNPEIRTIRSHIVKPLTKLQALIASDCGLVSASFIRFLPNLNTLVLSDNMLESLSMTELGSFKSLVKLSISRNKLTTIPDLKSCPLLNELRINQNRIQSISSEFIEHHSKQLKTLDISGNLLSDWQCVKDLAKMENLTNLTLHSNPLCTTTPPAETLSKDLVLKEDISSDSIEDVNEKIYRRSVLLIFQKTVGKLNKLFVQLIVLDNKRVKNKWTQGGAHKQDDHKVIDDDVCIRDSQLINDSDASKDKTNPRTQVRNEQASAKASPVLNLSLDISNNKAPEIIDNDTMQQPTVVRKKKKARIERSTIEAINEEGAEDEHWDTEVVKPRHEAEFKIKTISKQQEVNSEVMGVLLRKRQALESYGSSGWD